MIELSSEAVLSHLAQARIGRLCMATAEGLPYAIPMPFCWLDGALYLRVPMTGRKGQTLAANNRVCFEIDWFTDALDDYGSVLVEGQLVAVSDLSEKARAKRANEEKYSRLRRGYRPGHGRQTPLEELAMQKIVPTQLSGRIKTPATAPAEAGAT